VSITQPTVELIPLEPGGLAYFIIDSEKSGPVLEYINIPGLEKRHFNQLTESTNYAVAAIYPQESGLRFQLAAMGRFPASRIRTALRFTKEWVRLRSPVSKDAFWHSSGFRMSIAVDSRRLLISAGENDSAADPYVARGVPPPEGFYDYHRGAAISFWHENPALAINQLLREAGYFLDLNVPVETLFLSLFQDQEQSESDEEFYFKARLKLEAPDSSRARALEAFFSIASRNFTSGANAGITAGNAFNPAALVEILFANPPVREENSLNIITAALSGREIALLINLFSLY